MSISIKHLPSEISTDSQADLFLYDYTYNDAILKSKLNLTQHVFSFLLQGTKQLITHDKISEITNQQFILIKAGNCLISQQLSPSNTYRSILLFFSDNALLQFLAKNKIASKLTKHPMPYHVCQYDAYIHTFVKSLQQINIADKSLHQSLLQLKFDEIMLYLMHKKGVAFLQTFLNVHSNQTRHFINVIESNALNNLSVQELAFLCNMSISTFKREFEKNYQTSPIKWFNEKRLEHAAYILSNQSKRPIDIFGDIGYESLSSFIQSFKLQYGITPKQYQLNILSV